MRWFRPLLRRLDPLLAGTAPEDPLYLTRRTPWGWIVFASKVAAPFVITASIAIWASKSGVFRKPPPNLDPAPAEIGAKVLPRAGTLVIAASKDVEIPDVEVDTRGRALIGAVKNNTSRTIESVEVLFDVTDDNGSKLSGVKAHIENLAPASRSSFRVPISETHAAIAVVRDIRISEARQ
jgi:hypothetical protein